jgi:hypothetical protein
MGANGGKSSVIDLLADHTPHLLFQAWAGGEGTPPVPERSVAVRDRREPYMGDVVEQRHWRVEQAIAESLLEVRQGQKLLAQLRAVAQKEMPHTADFVGGLVAFDRALANGRMPAVVAVEVAQDRPDAIGWMRITT